MLNSEHHAILNELEQEQRQIESNAAIDEKINRNLPEILITGRALRDISIDGLSALRLANTPPILFIRDRELVHIVHGESGRYSIKPADPAYLRGRMDRTAEYVRVRKDTLIPIAPPKDVVNDILALDPCEWKFSPLAAIVEAPVFRPDGTVVTSSGYDIATHVFYHPAPGLNVPRIPERPGRADAVVALDTLLEVFSDFPFVDHASLANTLALLLTPIVRMAISGPVPLALLDAPQAGTGKSLLANVISQITTGAQAAMMPAPKDDEEWRKSITATLTAGTLLVIYDNVQHTLQAPSLAMALTTPCWKDRILGLSKTITVPQKATWIATGNNIRLGGDLSRRCYWIRLDAKLSRPWMRQGFRRSDLTGWIAMHRGELLAALLTLAAAWYAAGKPQGPACQIGSFEEWARVLSGILAHAGVIGFLSNLDELYELADPAMQQWEAFLLAVRDQYGDETFTVAELTTRLQREAALKEQLPEDLTTAWGNNEAGSIGFKVKLGKALRNRAGTQFGVDGLHLNRAGTERKGGQGRWRVLAGMQGSQGSNLSKSRSAEDQHGRNNPANPATLHDEDGPRSEGGVEPPGKLLNNENPANAPCFVCKGTTFRALRNGGWVCEVCHPEGVQKSGH